MGIEPTSRAWEAPILPLNYARSAKTIAQGKCADNGEMTRVLTAETQRKRRSPQQTWTHQAEVLVGMNPC
jgi:hypothetical protein